MIVQGDTAIAVAREIGTDIGADHVTETVRGNGPERGRRGAVGADPGIEETAASQEKGRDEAEVSLKKGREVGQGMPRGRGDPEVGHMKGVGGGTGIEADRKRDLIMINIAAAVGAKTRRKGKGRRNKWLMKGELVNLIINLKTILRRRKK